MISLCVHVRVSKLALTNMGLLSSMPYMGQHFYVNPCINMLHSFQDNHYYFQESRMVSLQHMHFMFVVNFVIQNYRPAEQFIITTIQWQETVNYCNVSMLWVRCQILFCVQQAVQNFYFIDLDFFNPFFFPIFLRMVHIKNSYPYKIIQVFKKKH